MGRATILGVHRYTPGGDKLKINDIVYELTHEKQKVSSSTVYTGRNMKKDSDFLTLHKILNQVGYAGNGDRN